MKEGATSVAYASVRSKCFEVLPTLMKNNSTLKFRGSKRSCSLPGDSSEHMGLLAFISSIRLAESLDKSAVIPTFRELWNTTLLMAE